MRSVWLSPGFPAAPEALVDALGADYTLAPPLTSPPAGSIAIVTGYERDLLARLSSRPADTSLVVITPPDATVPIDEVPGLRPDAVVAAASIAEVANALRRLPPPATPPLAAGGQDLPWWVRPPQDAPAAAAQPPHDTAVFATTPLPALGQPVDAASSATTETLAMGGEGASRRRFALTGRQARIASIAAVVIAVAAAGLAVGLDRHSPSPANAAATNGPGGANGAPFGNSNGTNPFSGQGGAGNGQSNGQGGSQDNSSGNGSSPQFGTPGGPFSGQSGSGNRAQDFQQFLACLKQNGVSIDTNQRPFFDPTDPQLRTALTKCASVMPFGRFGGRFGGGFGGGFGGSSSGTNGNGTNGTGTNGSHST